MSKAIYQQLLVDLAGLSAPEEAKRQFEELIRRSAAFEGVSSLERQERVQFARRLLDLKESRSVIRDRIMAKYGLKQSQAYKVIEQAVTVRFFDRKPDATGV